MRDKFRSIVIILTGLAGLIVLYSSFDSEADKRPVISDGEYARAWVECQNLMSMHNYYHGVNHNLEELAAIWVSEDGPYAKTATFSQPFGVWEGIDLIKVFYGKPDTKDPQQSLQEMVKNEPSAYPVGTMGIHLNTTPIIVVAGDGQTAKGIWYSPGPMFSYSGQKDEDGNDLAGGTLFMEKYGVDFVNENGQWKIWHIQMYYDYVFDMAADLTKPGVRQGPGPSGPPAEGDDGEAPPAGPMAQLPKPTRANPNPYEQWGPTRVSKLEPRLPERYYTFSETFSY